MTLDPDKYTLEVKTHPSKHDRIEIWSELASVGALAMDFLAYHLTYRFGGRWSVTYKGSPGITPKTNRPVRVYTVCWNQNLTPEAIETVKVWISTAHDYIRDFAYFRGPPELKEVHRPILTSGIPEPSESGLREYTFTPPKKGLKGGGDDGGPKEDPRDPPGGE